MGAQEPEFLPPGQPCPRPLFAISLHPALAQQGPPPAARGAAPAGPWGGRGLCAELHRLQLASRSRFFPSAHTQGLGFPVLQLQNRPQAGSSVPRSHSLAQVGEAGSSPVHGGDGGLCCSTLFTQRVAALYHGCPEYLNGRTAPDSPAHGLGVLLPSLAHSSQSCSLLSSGT